MNTCGTATMEQYEQYSPDAEIGRDATIAAARPAFTTDTTRDTKERKVERRQKEFVTSVRSGGKEEDEDAGCSRSGRTQQLVNPEKDPCHPHHPDAS